MIKLLQTSQKKTIVFYQAVDSPLIPLSSRYAPDQEAKRIVTKTPSQEGQKATDFIILLGLGNFFLGWEILKKYSLKPIIIFEEIPEIIEEFKKWLKDYYKLELLKRKEIFIINSESWKNQIADLLYQFKIKNLLILKNQKQFNKFPHFYQKVEKEIFRVKKQKEVNRSTISKFEKTWLRNLTQNTSLILKAYPLKEVIGIGRNKTAVVIGAGPSLKDDLKILKKNQDHFIILAVDTIFKTLLAQGIVPDFVLAIDPQKVNSKYLENIPPSGQKTILIAEPSICPKAFRSFKKVIIFDAIFPYYQFLIKNLGSRGDVEVGGSVITVALEVVKLMEFSKTTFLGLDLSYPPNQYHISGTLYEEYWFSSINRFKSYEMLISKITNSLDEKKTINRLGETVYIDTKFFLFKTWIEKKILGYQNKIFNSSKTGVEVKNMLFISFEDFIKKNCLIPAQAKKTKQNFLNNLQQEMDLHLKKNLSQEKSLLLEIKKSLAKLIQEFKTHLKKLNEILEKINQNSSPSSYRSIHSLKDFQISPTLKPFTEIIMQKTLYQLEEKENLSLEAIKQFFGDLKNALEFNLTQLIKIRF